MPLKTQFASMDITEIKVGDFVTFDKFGPVEKLKVAIVHTELDIIEGYIETSPYLLTFFSDEVKPYQSSKTTG